MSRMNDLAIKRDEMFEAWWALNKPFPRSTGDKKIARLAWGAAFSAGLSVGVEASLKREKENEEKPSIDSREVSRKNPA